MEEPLIISVKIELIPYRLKFKYPFKIAHGIRDSTDVVYVKLTHNGFTGWGEATLPPYLPETQESVIAFLSAIDVEAIELPLNPAQIFKSINGRFAGNLSAKAAFDMAGWNLKAALEGITIGGLLGLDSTGFPLCTYTLGVSTYDEMQVKVKEAEQNGFELFKIKLNGEDDKTALQNFRLITNKPFGIDVNQGWKTLQQAEKSLNDLLPFSPLLIEQPLPINMLHQMPELAGKFDVPFYADESCQTLTDIDRVMGAGFKGVNIKLMKCGGITPAIEMIAKARSLGLSVLIGCMSESSVGCTAAAHLTPLADYADLDGPYLISNDPFTGMKVKDGRIQINKLVDKCIL